VVFGKRDVPPDLQLDNRLEISEGHGPEFRIVHTSSRVGVLFAILSMGELSPPLEEASFGWRGAV
jgi:hypothetical protein